MTKFIYYPILTLGHVALLKNESRFAWSEEEENALLLEGFVFIRIHIPSESSKGTYILWAILISAAFVDVPVSTRRCFPQITIASVVSL